MSAAVRPPSVVPMSTADRAGSLAAEGRSWVPVDVGRPVTPVQAAFAVVDEAVADGALDEGGARGLRCYLWDVLAADLWIVLFGPAE